MSKRSREKKKLNDYNFSNISFSDRDGVCKFLSEFATMFKETKYNLVSLNKRFDLLENRLNNYLNGLNNSSRSDGLKRAENDPISISPEDLEVIAQTYNDDERNKNCLGLSDPVNDSHSPSPNKNKKVRKTKDTTSKKAKRSTGNTVKKTNAKSKIKSEENDYQNTFDDFQEDDEEEKKKMINSNPLVDNSKIQSFTQKLFDYKTYSTKKGSNIELSNEKVENNIQPQMIDSKWENKWINKNIAPDSTPIKEEQIPEDNTTSGAKKRKKRSRDYSPGIVES